MTEHPAYMVVTGNYACTKSDPNDKCPKKDEICTLHSKSTVSNPQIHKNNKELTVTCCDENGVGSRPDCISNVTFAAAYRKCVDLGLRLCTAEEIKSGSGATSGCSFDYKLTWTATHCNG